MKGILLINASQQDDLNQDENPNSSDKDLLFHSKQKSLQQNLQFEQSMLKEREQRVRQIEDDVLDINQIMRELNTLIYQQGESIGESVARFARLSFDSIGFFLASPLQIQLKTVLIMRPAMWKPAHPNWLRRPSIRPNIDEKWLFY